MKHATALLCAAVVAVQCGPSPEPREPDPGTARAAGGGQTSATRAAAATTAAAATG